MSINPDKPSHTAETPAELSADKTLSERGDSQQMLATPTLATDVDPPGRFVPEIDERSMWIDPLADSPLIQAGAVLLDTAVNAYAIKYNLLIDDVEFGSGKLKGGSFTMTPDENEAWIFTPNGDQELLKRGRDNIGHYFIVPRNSLVYVKLKQTLRLPFYIIGRHNLKIRYVYKGLLLGTGPQVDPGFVGNLFIPLHNFTTSDVRIYFTGSEKSFVSIDFVRTTPFLPETKIPKDIRTVDALRQFLEKLGHHRNLIEEKKVKKRKSLDDYLEGDKPCSQLKVFETNYEKFEMRVKDALKSIKKSARIERFILTLTVAALVLTSCGVMISTIGFFREDAADLKEQTGDVKALAASLNLSGLEKRIATLESNSLSPQQAKDLSQKINQILAKGVTNSPMRAGGFK